MRILYSPQFEREYRRLKTEIQKKAEEREQIFRNDPFDSRLKIHKLVGRLQGRWAFSIDYQYRIIFSFIGDDAVRFHAIGDHSIYKRL